MGLVREPGAAAVAARAIIEEARTWGMLGFDLEWDRAGEITWIGLGHAGRAVSFWAPTLPEDAWMVVKTAIADPGLPKLAHNIQAELRKWTERFGERACAGIWEDSLLLHHAAYPGIAHDLQQVAAQFLVVPPWKTWHRQADKAAEAAAKVEDAAAKDAVKQAARAARETTRLVTKAVQARDKAALQVTRFLETYPESELFQQFRARAATCADGEIAALAAEILAVKTSEADRLKAARSAQKAVKKQAEVEEQRTARAARKAANQVAHEARNAAAHAAKEARKAVSIETARLFASSTPKPGAPT